MSHSAIDGCGRPTTSTVDWPIIFATADVLRLRTGKGSILPPGRSCYQEATQRAYREGRRRPDGGLLPLRRGSSAEQNLLEAPRDGEHRRLGRFARHNPWP